MTQRFAIEVAYVRPNAANIFRLQVGEGTTIRQAIDQSGVLAACPEIDLARQAVGVFGEQRPLDAAVRAGDRIEIYRPLTTDPRELRRRRARG